MSEHDDAAPADEGRRRFLATTTVAVGAVGAVCLALPFARSLKPDAGARAAAAPVTVDIAGLKEGERRVVEWRGQPVWILHRSPAMLGRLAALELWYVQKAGQSPTPFSLGSTHHTPGESVADTLQRADSRLYRERARVRQHPRPAP